MNRTAITSDVDMTRECRVIAVEFTLRNSWMQQEVEMFSCDHRIPRDPSGRLEPVEAIFTLHTSHGDQQVRGWVQF